MRIKENIMAIKVLIADKDLNNCHFIADILKHKRSDVKIATDGQKAIDLIYTEEFDLAIIDLNLSLFSGIEILKLAKKTSSTSLVLMISHPTLELTVELMQQGAFDLLPKPPSSEKIEAILNKIEEKKLFKPSLSKKVVDSGTTKKIIAESPAIQRVLESIKHIAPSHASVFLSGESGTGKEVIAHAIHKMSPRVQCPFIRVNCAAVPETLIESEFFGHEKGAFTGAISKKLGRLELAHRGTLLLDEISETPLTLQPKLLRAIQEQEFERVGGTQSIKVDVRFISTSNRNMKEALDQKIFREDLYFRLAVVPIHLPPLRERREDIVPLADFFLERACLENQKPQKSLSVTAKQALLDYSWPGNIRELANLIERLVVLVPHSVIDKEDLHLETPHSFQTLEQMERQLILQTLAAHDQNKNKTAKALGVSLRTLRSKLLRYTK